MPLANSINFSRTSSTPTTTTTTTNYSKHNTTSNSRRPLQTHSHNQTHISASESHSQNSKLFDHSQTKTIQNLKNLLANKDQQIQELSSKSKAPVYKLRKEIRVLTQELHESRLDLGVKILELSKSKKLLETEKEICFKLEEKFLREREEFEEKVLEQQEEFLKFLSGFVCFL